MEQGKITAEASDTLRKSQINYDICGESPYDLIRIPVKHLAEIWEFVLPIVQKGQTANPAMTARDLQEGLLDQSIQMWLVLPQLAQRTRRDIEAVFFTSIERDKGEWVLSLYGLGGRNPREWVMACHEHMHRYARQEDCKRVRMCGRPAWRRILPGYAVTGTRQGHLVYERAVE